VYKEGTKMKLSKNEIIINIAAIQLIVFVIGKLFYGNYAFGILLIPFTVAIYKQRKKSLINKKIAYGELQFKDMLIAISDGLKVENAIKSSYKDLKNIYGKECFVCKELEIAISQLKLNISTEKVLKDMAERMELKNAILFSQIFSVAKRTGGNMPEIIKNVTDDIVMKENAREEINTSITEKRLEQKVMTLIPGFIIIYISVSSPEFLKIMYESIVGKIVMTICLILYLLAYIWGERIVDSIMEE
jgi:tight adherence protein B